MQEKYGLDDDYVKNVLKLPPPQKCKLYDIDKIVNSRKKLSTSEKIEHLLDLKQTLEHRLKLLRDGKQLKWFKVEKYKDYKERMQREGKPVKGEESKPPS